MSQFLRDANRRKSLLCFASLQCRTIHTLNPLLPFICSTMDVYSHQALIKVFRYCVLWLLWDRDFSVNFPASVMRHPSYFWHIFGEPWHDAKSIRTTWYSIHQPEESQRPSEHELSSSFQWKKNLKGQHRSTVKSVPAIFEPLNHLVSTTFY